MEFPESKEELCDFLSSQVNQDLVKFLLKDFEMYMTDESCEKMEVIKVMTSLSHFVANAISPLIKTDLNEDFSETMGLLVKGAVRGVQKAILNES